MIRSPIRDQSSRRTFRERGFAESIRTSGRWTCNVPSRVVLPTRRTEGGMDVEGTKTRPSKDNDEREGKEGRLEFDDCSRGSLCSRVAFPSSFLCPCSLAPHTEDIAVSLLTDIRIVSRQPAKSADLHCTGTRSKMVYRATRCSSTENHSRSRETSSMSPLLFSSLLRFVILRRAASPLPLPFFAFA